MNNRGFSVLRAVLAILGCMILAAVLVPGFMRTCACGQEASAIGSLRTINSAQSTYSGTCADGGYARTIEQLLQPPSAGATPFLPPNFDNNGHAIIISGYTITMRIAAGAELPGMSCNGGGRANGYFAEARPIQYEGLRFFATDERGTIYQSKKPIPSGMAGARPLE